MFCYRLFPLLLITAGLVFLTGAIQRPSPAPDEPQRLPFPTDSILSSLADPAATDLFHKAYQALRPERHPWLRTTFRMRSRIPDMRYRAEGTYLRGPGGLQRLELTSTPETEGGRFSVAHVLTLADGRDRWRISRTGAYATPIVRREPTAPGAPAPLPTPNGSDLLLASLANQFQWVRVDRQGDEAILTGVWLPPVRDSFAPPQNPWPDSLPRLCRLHLRGERRWAKRLEWWGPAKPDLHDRLLVEIDLEEPICDQPLSAEESARVFRYSPPAGKS